MPQFWRVGHFRRTRKARIGCVAIFNRFHFGGFYIIYNSRFVIIPHRHLPRHGGRSSVTVMLHGGLHRHVRLSFHALDHGCEFLHELVMLTLALDERPAER